MSAGPTFFGRFWGHRHFGRPFWGPRESPSTETNHHGAWARLVAIASEADRKERRRRRLVLLALAIEEALEE